MVVEKNPNGFERSYDIYSRLLEDFIVFVTGPIDIAVANTFIAQLLFLESKDAEREVSIYINTPGGEVTSGLAMYDTMKHIKNDVSTINVGLAASMGSLLLSGGTKGKRYALPESKTMIHQPLISGGLSGQMSDIQIEAKEGLRVKTRIMEIIAENSGKNPEQVEKDMDRNFWLTADETLKYGLIDKVLSPKKKS